MRRRRARDRRRSGSPFNNAVLSAITYGLRAVTFFARHDLRCAPHGIEQYVMLGRRRIHLSHEAQRTQYGSNAATYESERRCAMSFSSVRLARRRLRCAAPFGPGWSEEEGRRGECSSAGERGASPAPEGGAARLMRNVR